MASVGKLFSAWLIENTLQEREDATDWGTVVTVKGSVHHTYTPVAAKAGSANKEQQMPNLESLTSSSVMTI